LSLDLSICFLASTKDRFSAGVPFNYSTHATRVTATGQFTPKCEKRVSDLSCESIDDYGVDDY